MCLGTLLSLGTFLSTLSLLFFSSILVGKRDLDFLSLTKHIWHQSSLSAHDVFGFLLSNAVLLCWNSLDLTFQVFKLPNLQTSFSYFSCFSIYSGITARENFFSSKITLPSSSSLCLAYLSSSLAAVNLSFSFRTPFPEKFGIYFL